MWKFVFPLLVGLSLANSESCRPINILLPKVILPGQSANALVNFLDDNEAHNVTFRLARSSKNLSEIDLSTNVLASNHVYVKGHGVIWLDIPNEEPNWYEIQVLLNDTSNNNYTIVSRSIVKLSGSVRDVIIRTSSNYYKPGETVFQNRLIIYTLRLKAIDLRVWAKKPLMQISSSDKSNVQKINEVITDILNGFLELVFPYKGNSPMDKDYHVTFWILAVDQDLHMPVSSIADIHVEDSRNIVQVMWEDIPLFEGMKEFKLPISERTPLGVWTIVVNVEGTIYRSELNISLSRGSKQLVNRDQVVTEKHFVELHFSQQMRKKYKPGLPLMGKVEAVSSEKEVRVRVKVIDEQLIVIYSQDIDTQGRESTFYVPAVITNTSRITVQAELISLGGKDIDSQYVLAKETLRKWESKSNCFLLIKELQSDLKPNMDAEVTILTSCPCTGDMHYVIMTEGRLVSWGDFTANHSNTTVVLDNIMQGVNIYEYNISFSVAAEMAPTSHLLVYYAGDAGEIIEDSIRFDVKLQHERVSLILDENNVWYVDDKIRVGILSFPKTHICLVGGKSEDMPFWNKETYDKQSRNYKDDIFSDSCGNPVNKKLDLPQHESFFPSYTVDKVWIWKCFNYTENIESNGVTLAKTNEAGKWKLWAFAMSDTVELRIADPITVNVFAPVAVEFSLPKTVKVMEIIQVEITITNHINSCVDIHAVISLSEGMIYPGIDMSIVSEKLRLGGHGATSIVVRIQPITPGFKTMNANVSCYIREGCQEVINSFNDFDTKVPLTSLVSYTSGVEAVPEGIQKVHTESAYFCANEETLSIPSKITRYTYVSAPRKKASIIFDVIAENNCRIALSEEKNSTEKVYQIFLGDSGNKVSWIGRGINNHLVHLVTAQTPFLLSGIEYQTFWLSWEHALLTVGHGHVVGRGTFLAHRMDPHVKVNYVGFSTNWGVEGRIRISDHNDEAGYSQVLRLDIPHRILTGSEKGNLYVTSGLSLPLIFQHVEMKSNGYPFSSLSSVISSFSPILLLDEMDESDWMHHKYDRKFVHNQIGKNIQTLLTYMNDDYSFSDHPNIPDLISTVRVFEILCRSQYYWKVDPDLISRVKLWIVKHQHKDGSFEADGAHRIEDKIAITAEIIATFAESGYDEDDLKMLNKAQNYIESNIELVNDTYVLAVSCYGFTLMKHESAEEIMERIHISDVKDGENDWYSQSTSVPSPFEWLYDKSRTIADDRKKYIISAYINDYKAAAYTVLVFSTRRNLKNAEPIMKYLFQRSNVLDQHPEITYLAAKAFVMFASISRDMHSSLTVSLATSGMELTDTLELKSEHAPHVLQLPSLPTKVFIYATGAGCSTVQSQVLYSTYETASTFSLDMKSFIEEEIPAHYNIVGDPEGLFPQLIIKSCFKLENASTGIRMEAILFSGYKLESVLSVVPSNLNYTFGSNNNRVWFVFANVPERCGICTRFLVQSPYIISALRPMFFRMYEIENPQIVEEKVVHSMNKDSLLRTDLTDGHFTSWFGDYWMSSVNDSTEKHEYENCDALQNLTLDATENATMNISESEETRYASTEYNLASITEFVAEYTNINGTFEDSAQTIFESSVTEQTTLQMNEQEGIQFDITTQPEVEFTTYHSTDIVTESLKQPANEDTTSHVTESVTTATNEEIGKLKRKKVPTDYVMKLKAKKFQIKNDKYTKAIEKFTTTDLPAVVATTETPLNDLKQMSNEIFDIGSGLDNGTGIVVVKKNDDTRRKGVNKIVVGQNELVFDMADETMELVKSTETTKVTITPTNTLWGMLKEVAYDNKHKREES